MIAPALRTALGITTPHPKGTAPIASVEILHSHMSERLEGLGRLAGGHASER